ncbi:RING-H2 finger protein ATL8-like [Typha latifolia]|uniref:RING-H2 finger protein ATL8-like n=1 Tax=Typha latifolia TaxID=4733 RepID=UPI003C2D6FE1
MPPASRILQTNSSQTPAAPPPDSMDSDAVFFLAALLCALVCVVGLALVARCAWAWRSSSVAGGGGGGSPQLAPANKGIKKKALQSLPTASYGGDGGEMAAECAICLAEFVEGEEIRILPQCGHRFHVGCVDTWLRSRASCPSCRRVLVVAAPLPPCRRCATSSAAAEVEEGAKAREDGYSNRFLP